MVSESESLWPRFKRRMKRKSKNRSSAPSPFSNYAVEISPNQVISGKSEGLVKIVSICREGELIPVILSSARKAISNKQQPASKKKKPLGFDAAEIKVKSHDAADVSAKSSESDVRTEELAAKQIPEAEEKVGVRKPNRRLWVRIGKAFQFPTVPDLHQNSRTGLKVSQDSLGGDHAKDTEAPVIEQAKTQKILLENELPYSIPVPIDEASKSSRISAEVESKSVKILKSIDFHRKLNSHGSAPNSAFKRQGIESSDPLCSSSSCPQLLRPVTAAMPKSPKPNSQHKKLKMSAKRKGTRTQTSTKILRGATGECEGSVSAINLWFLIIIMGCLVVLSNRLLAVVCTSLWWYLLSSLLGRK